MADELQRAKEALTQSESMGHLGTDYTSVQALQAIAYSLMALHELLAESTPEEEK